MEDKEGPSPGVTVKGNEAPEGYHVAPRTENTTTHAGPTMQAAAVPPASAATPPGPGTGSEIKKKRGRPRKYAPDGSLAAALSPMPISSSIPLTGEYPTATWKRGRGRPVDSVKKSHKKQTWQGTRIFSHLSSCHRASVSLFCALVVKKRNNNEVHLLLCMIMVGKIHQGDRISYFVGANFTPHVLTVNAGEDVTMKVMSFSQQGARAICILSANGTISNVTLRQPTSSGGTLTYEGRFEILSLSGSYMPTDNGGTRSRSGGMSISLAGPDGRVLGGGLAGLLVAAGPVQVVVGSFLPGHQQEQKHKKQRTEHATAVISPVSMHTTSTDGFKMSYGGVKPILTSPSFHGDDSGSLTPIQGFRNSAMDNRSSSPGEESKGNSLSQCEVSS
ncbi:hypothetical protein COLO4_14180 [Corchorus olitorius]|uniref:AT-hook motif nuclear-localized protein n=1 Tax=Corchorus olitorius TaxID=93759 RepID=A0A1R3JT92_9ROSI|nr:hypothetical protein COLO4_14180 [Corchorus olitorius]